MDDVLARIVAWGEREDAVRLLVLTSSRAAGAGDHLSDYDIVAALTDLDRFDPTAAYRRPAARWGDTHDVHGVTTFFRGVVYDDGVKIDWTLWPASVPELVADHGLSDDLDVGYRVLLDKDGVTARWAEPSFESHVTRKPTEEEYAALVEEFWWSATYVAKADARGEHFHARYALDVDMTYTCLRRMLEWRIAMDRDWAWKPGAAGRGLDREVPELDGVRDSFERTVDLFRTAAHEVGDRLGYAYPQLADDAVSAYVARVRGDA